MRTASSSCVLLVVAGIGLAAAQTQAPRPLPPPPATVGGGASRSSPPRRQAFDAVDIVSGDQVVRRVDAAAIRMATTGQITRYGQQFAVTPFETVMKLAAIPADAAMRVVGEQEQLVLQAGSKFEDPTRYGVIFNTRGFPVLTPLPKGLAPARGAEPAARESAPRGSGGQGAGTSQSGGRGAPGPGTPQGFAPLKEVRSFTRIEILP
jgi:hypothetical protein